ncbi:hypothetical protein IWQ60_002047 [Tieghemiomyces parasiticus]|uniref:Uncharacterized protein n=1 Tax=Tieghemiomyces parasiticus TaxID=78921 RepID=A0A9W8AFI9_9FUNG|nr:hypothetical protein IWQ60_002047 [Tieghemiomyces parasiticus]
MSMYDEATRQQAAAADNLYAKNAHGPLGSSTVTRILNDIKTSMSRHMNFEQDHMHDGTGAANRSGGSDRVNHRSELGSSSTATTATTTTPHATTEASGAIAANDHHATSMDGGAANSRTYTDAKGNRIEGYAKEVKGELFKTWGSLTGSEEAKLRGEREIQQAENEIRAAKVQSPSTKSSHHHRLFNIDGGATNHTK